ncbi:MAG: hypothetical protein AABX03_05095 [Nanoarchaeota archaeon]
MEYINKRTIFGALLPLAIVSVLDLLLQIFFRKGLFVFFIEFKSLLFEPYGFVPFLVIIMVLVFVSVMGAIIARKTITEREQDERKITRNLCIVIVILIAYLLLSTLGAVLIKRSLSIDLLESWKCETSCPYVNLYYGDGIEAGVYSFNPGQKMKVIEECRYACFKDYVSHSMKEGYNAGINLEANRYCDMASTDEEYDTCKLNILNKYKYLADLTKKDIKVNYTIIKFDVINLNCDKNTNVIKITLNKTGCFNDPEVNNLGFELILFNKEGMRIREPITWYYPEDKENQCGVKEFEFNISSNALGLQNSSIQRVDLFSDMVLKSQANCE